MTMDRIDNEISASTGSYITGVYGWMTLGLLLTAMVAFGIDNSPGILALVAGNSLLIVLLLVLEVAAVGILAAAINRLSIQLARVIFVIYAILNGITLSGLFVIFTGQSLFTTFFTAGLTFGIMSLWGMTTKSNLTRAGNIALMFLVGLIVATLINLFFHSSVLYWSSTVLGIFIFVILIAVDTQKIRNIAGDAPVDPGRMAIVGALTLYLDLINLVLFLLRIFGRRRREW